LLPAARADLAAKARHVSQIEGDGAGYDIESFEIDGTPKFIEVKTTRGDGPSSWLAGTKWSSPVFGRSATTFTASTISTPL
jgi:Domain of unknown function (DUF3883)